jgi:TnpA family transposase
VLLKRPPGGEDELLALYGAILVHGMGLSVAEITKMMPGLAEARVTKLMILLDEEGRLQAANTAVVQFMRRHRITQAWGEFGLASSDMMTLEATHKLGNARIDPRARAYAIGTYTHVLDQWGIVYDQPIILNRRQAGAAIAGALRQNVAAIDRLALDTHGYTAVGMGIAKTSRLRSMSTPRHAFGSATHDSALTVCASRTCKCG